MTLEDLEAAVTPEVLARGIAYWEDRHVRMAFCAQGRLQALVAGALGDYHVQVFRDQQGLRSVCECGYRQGMCKHAAALAWGFISEPASLIKVEDLQKQLGLMDMEALRGLVQQLAAMAPHTVAKALGMEVCPVDGRVIWRFLGGLRRVPKRPGWLRAWWRVLKIVEEEPPTVGNNQVLAELLRLALKHLAHVRNPPEEFWASFRRTVALWCDWQPMVDRPPSWWTEVTKALPTLAVDDQRKLAWCLAEGLGGKWADLLLPTLGYPPDPADEEFAPFLELTVALLIKAAKEQRAILQWALLRVERALVVLDLYEEAKAWALLKQLAKAGLTGFPRENKYIFRARLAVAHRELGEHRQALALLKANFGERPGYAEFVELMELAEIVGERAGTLTTACDVVRGCGRLDLLAQIWRWAGELDKLAAVAIKLPPAEPLGVELAEALRPSYPKIARELWERWTLYLLVQGTRRAVQEAVPVLVALKRLCREEGWTRRWEAIRRRARDLLLDPVSREMLGSLLES